MLTDITNVECVYLTIMLTDILKRKPCPSATLSTRNRTWTAWDGTHSFAVTGCQLTVLAMAHISIYKFLTLNIHNYEYFGCNHKYN